MKYNFSVTGYKDDSPDKDNNYNVIPGRNITMQGVSKSLTLVPIVNGKPQYDRKKSANPGDPDIEFEDDVEGVLELPYAQSGIGRINSFNLQSALYPNQNLNAALDYSIGGVGSTYAENANLGFQNPYVNNQQTQTNLPGSTTPGLDPSRAVAPNFNAPPAYDSSIPSQSALNQFNSRVNTMEIGTGSNTGIPENLDPNQLQKYQADLVKQQQQRNQNRPFNGAINPYGGWNMENTATALGAFAENGNILGTVSSAGKLLLSGARNYFAGSAAAKNYNESMQEYENKTQNAERTQGWNWLQKGGEVGKILTGNYITGDDDNPNPNVEFERGEYAQTPDGQSMEVIGDKHSEGGEMATLPDGSRVISDYLKIGSKLATYFKKEHNLNVKSGSSFSTVLDQYKKKIGLDKLIDEEAKLMDKIADQEDVEFEGTREINLEVLSKKVNEMQPQKQELEDRFNTFTNLVYEKQEETKEPSGYNFEKQKGGEINSAEKDAYLKKNFTGLTNEKYKNVKIDPNVVVSNLNGGTHMSGFNTKPDWMKKRDDEFMQGYLYEASRNKNITLQNGKWIVVKQEGGDIQAAPDSQAPPVGQTPPQSTDGQMPAAQAPQSEIERLILAYSQITGTDPATVVQQLQELDEAGLQQAIQQMMQAVQQTDKAPEAVTPDPTQVEQEQIAQPEQTEQFKKGGQYYAQRGMSPDEFNSYMTQYRWEPNYGYGDLNAQRTSLEPVLNRMGIQYDPNDLGTQTSQDAFAGQAQTAFRNQYKATSDHYSSLVAGTQTGLQNALDNNLVTESQLKNLGVKVKDGTVLRGSKGIVPSDNEEKLVNLITKAGTEKPEAYKNYVDKNFVDNKWYFRFPDVKDVQFNDDKTRDEYIKKGDYKLIEDTNGKQIYYSNKQGLYFSPTVGNEAPSTPATPGATAPNTGNPSGDLNPFGNRDRNYDNGLPMAVPDQSNLPPNYIPTTLRQVGSVQANPIAISPEATLQELNRQYNTASNQLTESNPYTAGAISANLQAQANNSINQAYSQAALANAQDRRNVENANEERILQRDTTNLGLMGQYEKEAITGLDNYVQSWRNYIDNRNLQNVNNWNLENQRQAFNAVNDNFKIGSMGWYQTDESPVFYFTGLNGQPMAYNTRTKQTYEVSRKNQDGTKTRSTTETTTNPPKNRQKGGLLLSKDIKNWLK